MPIGATHQHRPAGPPWSSRSANADQRDMLSGSITRSGPTEDFMSQPKHRRANPASHPSATGAPSSWSIYESNLASGLQALPAAFPRAAEAQVRAIWPQSVGQRNPPTPRGYGGYWAR